jgi:Family of unknown function (DUF5939)
MLDEQALEGRLTALEAARPWSPRVVSRLEKLLRSGPEEALYRVNPVQFAVEKAIAETEAIDLFLHAKLAGLFEMDWLLVCPMCSDVVESFRSLRTVHNHFHCPVCQTDYEAALDDYIVVRLSPCRPRCGGSAFTNRTSFRRGTTRSSAGDRRSVSPTTACRGSK